MNVFRATTIQTEVSSKRILLPLFVTLGEFAGPLFEGKIAVKGG
jgi:hypothetical protein